ncbi:MAG: SIS domain-containing protein [Oligoflexales bacterium]
MKQTLKNEDLINWGKEAIREEAVSLDRTRAGLNGVFADSVHKILDCSGKVVVTGLGKSGHVARKIAATLASTGTSAFFLHPAEALHGDFGKISSNDILLAIAYGGETREVIEVCKFCRRNDVPVISITGKLNSELAKISLFSLDGSVEKEACPLNLAPTSSAIVAMALGDALAVALMKARGFDNESFARLHPEGSLGKKLALVSQYTKNHDDLFELKENSNFHDILAKVTQFNYGIAAVVNGKGELVGAISDGDLRRVLVSYEEKTFQLTAKDFMTKAPRTIEESRLVIDAINLMEKAKITSVFVVAADSPKKPVGILRLHDILTAKVL